MASAAIAEGGPPAYYVHETNKCPGCGRGNWLVGRLLAECAFCATALPIQHSSVSSSLFTRAK